MRYILNPFRHTSVTPIDFDPILWFRADQGVKFGGVQATNGGSVDYWQDLVSGTANAEQTTPAWRPTYHTNELNGRPIVRFDNSSISSNFSQHLRIPNANCPAEFSGIGQGEYTIFVVAKMANFTNAAYLLSKSNLHVNSQIPVLQLTASLGRISIGTATNVIVSGFSPTVATWGTFGITRSESGMFMYYWLDGIQVDSDSLFSGSGNNTQPCFLGARADGNTLGDTGAAGMAADIAEMVVFDQAFNPTQAAQLQTYFASRYNL